MSQPKRIRKKTNKKKTRKVFVGDSDHEPDKEYVQDIPIQLLKK